MSLLTGNGQIEYPYYPLSPSRQPQYRPPSHTLPHRGYGSTLYSVSHNDGVHDRAAIYRLYYSLRTSVYVYGRNTRSSSIGQSFYSPRYDAPDRGDPARFFGIIDERLNESVPEILSSVVCVFWSAFLRMCFAFYSFFSWTWCMVFNWKVIQLCTGHYIHVWTRLYFFALLVEIPHELYFEAL